MRRTAIVPILLAIIGITLLGIGLYPRLAKILGLEDSGPSVTLTPPPKRNTPPSKHLSPEDVVRDVLRLTGQGKIYVNDLHHVFLRWVNEVKYGEASYSTPLDKEVLAKFNDAFKGNDFFPTAVSELAKNLPAPDLEKMKNFLESPKVKDSPLVKQERAVLQMENFQEFANDLKNHPPDPKRLESCKKIVQAINQDEIKNNFINVLKDYMKIPADAHFRPGTHPSAVETCLYIYSKTETSDLENWAAFYNTPEVQRLLQAFETVKVQWYKKALSTLAPYLQSK